MGKAKSLLYSVLGVVVLVGIVVVLIDQYSFIFSRHVTGEIIGVERVAMPVAIMNGGDAQSTPGMFSFAVAIRDTAGVIHTASSEDRQWAIAKPGFCADAVFYPYPFWNLEKRGTYMNARLKQLSDCATKSPVSAPALTAPVQPGVAPSPVSVPAAEPAH